MIESWHQTVDIDSVWFCHVLSTALLIMMCERVRVCVCACDVACLHTCIISMKSWEFGWKKCRKNVQHACKCASTIHCNSYQTSALCAPESLGSGAAARDQKKGSEGGRTRLFAQRPLKPGSAWWTWPLVFVLLKNFNKESPSSFHLVNSLPCSISIYTYSMGKNTISINFLRKAPFNAKLLTFPSIQIATKATLASLWSSSAASTLFA